MRDKKKAAGNRGGGTAQKGRSSSRSLPEGIQERYQVWVRQAHQSGDWRLVHVTKDTYEGAVQLGADLLNLADHPHHFKIDKFYERG